jgi:hypothetical protein
VPRADFRAVAEQRSSSCVQQSANRASVAVAIGMIAGMAHTTACETIRGVVQVCLKENRGQQSTVTLHRITRQQRGQRLPQQ